MFAMKFNWMPRATTALVLVAATSMGAVLLHKPRVPFVPVCLRPRPGHFKNLYFLLS
jgi:hypothetical protein